MRGFGAPALRAYRKFGQTRRMAPEHLPISGDRPIEVAAEDRLGFKPLAERLAGALIQQASREGLVVGLEGRWGSGKSSLLNLTVKVLQAMPAETRPVVVEFKPWLVGDRDALLAAFFGQLALEVENVELESGQSATREKRERGELLGRIRGYAAKAETFGSIVAAIPIASPFGTALKEAGAALKEEGAGPTLLQLKRELDASLARLARRIVVTIDDVDRLEPREVIELLRLVRSVADFKNITYVLCFDGDILAQSIQTGIHVTDGHAYLEKIIQISLAVPIPEPFHLRRWFEQELAKFAAADDQDTNQRLTTVIDREGGRRLTTPRAVVRTLNALSLLIPSLRTEVDLPDLVWLQLIKSGNNKFYRWIEEYCASASATSTWRVSVSDETKKQLFEDLQVILAADSIGFDRYRIELSDHLPAISRSAPWKEKDNPIHASDERASIERAIRDKRLASPDHYRLYFALSQPVFAPKADDYRRLLDAASAPKEEVGELLLEWARQRDPTVGTMADVMLDRIRQRAGDTISGRQAEHILLALSDVMDEATDLGEDDDFGSPALWREAQRCIPSLRLAMDGGDASRSLEGAFGEGKALGWLTDLLRYETFSHGRYGDRQSPEADWLLSDPELDIITERMLSRYRSMSFDDFVALPNTVSALFAWSQAGDSEGPRDVVAAAAADDEGLVHVLESMTSWVRSSRGNYVKLGRANVEPLLDYEASRIRIGALAADSGSPLQGRAETLRGYFDAERF
jgi:hypothetical protein